MPNTTSINIVELKPPDFDRAADLLAEAFYNNPSHVYIFQEDRTRSRLLKWGLKANLKLNLTPPNNIGKSFALVESDRASGKRKIQAMAFWHPPECGSINWIDKLKSGWAIAPFKFGKDTYQRLIEVMGEMDRIKVKVSNGERSWFLNNMAVVKELRGTGIGTKVLNNQFKTVVDPSGFPALLMTQKAANVAFYRRLGFQVVTESTVGSGEHAFTNWCMVRLPTS